MTYTAQPVLISRLAQQTKCIMCRHRKDEGHILPAGEFKPSGSWLFHYQDTHGIDHDIMAEWLYLLPYYSSAEKEFLFVKKWGNI